MRIRFAAVLARPVLFFLFSPDPARRALAFSIDPTDREPGTGYDQLRSSTTIIPQ